MQQIIFIFLVLLKEHEPWCKRYMELYNELRENWERLYWDEGYSKKIAKDHANYDSAEDDDQDFNPYRFLLAGFFIMLCLLIVKKKILRQIIRVFHWHCKCRIYWLRIIRLVSQVMTKMNTNKEPHQILKVLCLVILFFFFHRLFSIILSD